MVENFYQKLDVIWACWENFIVDTINRVIFDLFQRKIEKGHYFHVKTATPPRLRLQWTTCMYFTLLVYYHQKGVRNVKKICKFQGPVIYGMAY